MPSCACAQIVIGASAMTRQCTWRRRYTPCRTGVGARADAREFVMPRRIRDLALAALGAALLIGALALIDQRVPAQVAGVAREVSSGGWHARGSAIDNLVADVTGSAVANDLFLFSMVAAGVVLVILMVRT
jgi:hypothetical protein